MAVYKRGTRWYYDFTIRRKRFREVIPEATTKAQAEQAETFFKQAIFENKFGNQKGNTMFEDFAKRVYLKWAKDNKRSAFHDENQLPHFLPYFKDMTLKEITGEHVERFKQARKNEITNRGTKRSANTVNRDLALISKIFSLAVDYSYLDDTPCRRVKFFKTEAEEKKIMTLEDEAKLLASIPENDRLRQIIQVALKTGMRRGEIMKLKWENIDFAKKLICIPAEITKTNHSRTLPLMPDVEEILNSLRARYFVDELIFTGWRASLSCISDRFQVACKKAGLEGYTFHCLRHTFSTRLKDANANPFVIRDWLGHRMLSMTNHYSHATPESMRQAVSQLLNP